MNEQEALQICRLAHAASPAQKVDDYTPELWAMVLVNIRFTDARDALIELAAEQEWIHVSHIVKRVKLIRKRRLDAYGQLPEPPRECFDPAAYKAWLRQTTRAIADGELVERPPMLTATPEHKRKLLELMAGSFHGPDEM